MAGGSYSNMTLAELESLLGETSPTQAQKAGQAWGKLASALEAQHGILKGAVDTLMGGSKTGSGSKTGWKGSAATSFHPMANDVLKLNHKIVGVAGDFQAALEKIAGIIAQTNTKYQAIQQARNDWTTQAANAMSALSYVVWWNSIPASGESSLSVPTPAGITFWHYDPIGGTITFNYNATGSTPVGKWPVTLKGTADSSGAVTLTGSEGSGTLSTITPQTVAQTLTKGYKKQLETLAGQMGSSYASVQLPTKPQATLVSLGSPSGGIGTGGIGAGGIGTGGGAGGSFSVPGGSSGTGGGAGGSFSVPGASGGVGSGANSVSPTNPATSLASYVPPATGGGAPSGFGNSAFSPASPSSGLGSLSGLGSAAGAASGLGTGLAGLGSASSLPGYNPGTTAAGVSYPGAYVPSPLTAAANGAGGSSGAGSPFSATGSPFGATGSPFGATGTASNGSSGLFNQATAGELGNTAAANDMALGGAAAMSANRGGMPMMPPMMPYGMQGGAGERYRKSWLPEEENIWGVDEETAVPAVIVSTD